MSQSSNFDASGELNNRGAKEIILELVIDHFNGNKTIDLANIAPLDQRIGESIKEKKISIKEALNAITPPLEKFTELVYWNIPLLNEEEML